mgnify:FL=1
MVCTVLFRGVSDLLTTQTVSRKVGHAGTGQTSPFGGASVTPARSAKVRGVRMQVIVLRFVSLPIFRQKIRAENRMSKLLKCFCGFVFVCVKACSYSSISGSLGQYVCGVLFEANITASYHYICENRCNFHRYMFITTVCILLHLIYSKII